jgi:hypothetical protein
VLEKRRRMEGRTGPTASEVKGWGINEEVTAVFL